MSRPDVGLVGLKGPPGSVPSDSNDDCMKGAPKWAPFLQTSGLLVILEATRHVDCILVIDPNTEDFL